jgi:hypothetical protein
MRKTFAALLMAATAALAAPAAAAPLVYNESLDGSLGYGEAIGNLGVGINTVTGRRNQGVNEAFRVTLLEGLRLTTASMTVSNFTAPDPAWFDGVATLNLWEDGTERAVSELIRANGTYEAFSGAWDGPVVLDALMLGFIIPFGSFGVSYDYTVSFTVAETPPAAPLPVPEPLGLALFGAGLAGLAAVRRRTPTTTQA